MITGKMSNVSCRGGRWLLPQPHPAPAPHHPLHDTDLVNHQESGGGCAKGPGCLNMGLKWSRDTF